MHLCSWYRFRQVFLNGVERGIKEGNFSEARCQNILKGEILLDRVIVQSTFCVLEYSSR